MQGVDTEREQRCSTVQRSIRVADWHSHWWQVAVLNGQRPCLAVVMGRAGRTMAALSGSRGTARWRGR